jgi:hypothetical protein
VGEGVIGYIIRKGKYMKILIFFGMLSQALMAQADCKTQLINIVGTAEDLILSSDLDPRCKALGLKGGKQNCVQATEGTIWDLKALMEPILKQARNHCKKNICSSQQQLCSGLLSNEHHLLAVGIYGLLDDIEDANW